MKRVWRYAGRIAFILSLPALIVYLRFGKRTRVVVHYDGKIVVTRGWLGNGKWCLPGGGLHRGEEKAKGAVREVREETGMTLDVGHLRYLGAGILKEKLFRFEYEMYGIDLATAPVLRPQRFEILDVQLIDPDTINLSNMTPESVATVAAWRQSR